MKVFKIWADINSTGLFDEEGNIILQDETTIKDDTWIELQEWVKEYEFIVSMDLIERRNIQNKITDLDNTGINLLYKIKNEWDRDIYSNEMIKIKYYSEGLMKFLI